MARKLKDDIKQAIRSENRLMADYADFIGVNIYSLPKLFERNSKVLTHHDAVKFLSQRLSKSVDEILIDDKVMA